MNLRAYLDAPVTRRELYVGIASSAIALVVSLCAFVAAGRSAEQVDAMYRSLELNLMDRPGEPP